MKICIISYDFFGYDKHIILELQKNGIETTHIDLNKHNFSYSSYSQKVFNFFSKIFLNRNLKKIKINQFIFNQLDHIGYQDQILVIRPDLISKKAHLKIKKYTSVYNCYLYDSSKRFKIKHLAKNIFDNIYSYDLDDIKKFNFIPLTNYIFIDKTIIKKKYQNTIFLVMSLDERLPILCQILEQLEKINIKSKCIVVSNHNYRPEKTNKNIEFRKDKVPAIKVEEMMENSEIFLDLIRKNHNGLSFRIFEALAMQRKIITTNQSIKNYDFYNPNNILVIDENNIKINKSFFETSYQPLKDEIYYKYTIQNWVKTIFKL